MLPLGHTVKPAATIGMYGFACCGLILKNPLSGFIIASWTCQNHKRWFRNISSQLLKTVWRLCMNDNSLDYQVYNRQFKNLFPQHIQDPMPHSCIHIYYRNTTAMWVYLCFFFVGQTCWFRRSVTRSQGYIPTRAGLKWDVSQGYIEHLQMSTETGPVLRWLCTWNQDSYKKHCIDQLICLNDHQVILKIMNICKNNTKGEQSTSKERVLSIIIVYNCR